jgi:hypothetical protein
MFGEINLLPENTRLRLVLTLGKARTTRLAGLSRFIDVSTLEGKMVLGLPMRWLSGRYCGLGSTCMRRLRLTNH